MATLLTILVIFAFLVLAGGIGWLWLRMTETARHEALQALAARRGWALTIVEERLGRPGILRLTPRGGPGWTVETRLADPQRRGPRPPLPGLPVTASMLVTEFVAEEPHWKEGLLILAPPLPEDPPLPEGADPIDLPARFEAEATRHLLATAVGPALPGPVTARIPEDAPDLRLWPSPPALSVFCSGPPVPRFDLGDLAKFYAAYTGETRMRPVVIFGPEGLRVHLPNGLRRADQMERFIDFVLEGARIL